MLEPEGARFAVSRMRAIRSCDTGFCRNARVLLRPRMASSTVIWHSVWLMASFFLQQDTHRWSAGCRSRLRQSGTARDVRLLPRTMAHRTLPVNAAAEMLQARIA